MKALVQRHLLTNNNNTNRNTQKCKEPIPADSGINAIVSLFGGAWLQLMTTSCWNKQARIAMYRFRNIILPEVTAWWAMQSKKASEDMVVWYLVYSLGSFRLAFFIVRLGWNSSSQLIPTAWQRGSILAMTWVNSLDQLSLGFENTACTNGPVSQKLLASWYTYALNFKAMAQCKCVSATAALNQHGV